ncbi:MAG: COX15/CtaA family protein [Actinomycetota bacterium]|nr:COX15/CtaA family protein [Actinomycetota bacterium]
MRVTSPEMERFRRLAVASTVATFVLIAIGGVVRATKSGLGCGTDWPDCSGELLPPLASRALAIEYSHRLMASIVLLMLAGLAGLAVWRHRGSPAIMWPSITAFGLVVFQALLGAVVVKLELQAVSVVLHLGTALLLVGVLVYLVAASSPGSDRPPKTDRSLSRRGAMLAGAVWLLLLSGSYVTGADAGYVFPDWPLMNGSLLPNLTVESYAIHWTHRVLAALVGVLVVLFAVKVMRRKSDMPGAARLAHAVAGGYVLQILIGAANIWSRLNAAVVTAHLLVGALLFGGLVGISVAVHPSLQRAGIEEPAGRGRPAFRAATE